MGFSTFPAATTTGGEVGNPALTVVEVDLGSTPVKSGTFTIAGTGLTVGNYVHVLQAVGPYTGKGTLADEAVMDTIRVSARVTSTTQITAYWQCQTRVKGNFKFTYLLGG